MRSSTRHHFTTSTFSSSTYKYSRSFFFTLADNDNLQFNSNTEKHKVKATTFNVVSDDKLAYTQCFKYV